MKRDTRVVVRSATYARGYTGRDHLLNDGDFSSIVGKVFPSDIAAEKAAEKVKTTHMAPTRLDLVPFNDVPAADVKLATRRALDAGAGIVEPDTADNCTPTVDRSGYAVAIRQIDYTVIGADVTPGQRGTVRIYR